MIYKYSNSYKRTFILHVIIVLYTVSTHITKNDNEKEISAVSSVGLCEFS